MCYILIYLVSLGTFYKYKKNIKESAKLALIVPSALIITLIIVAVSLFAIFYFESEKVGILKQDLDGIKDIPTYFIEFEGDELVRDTNSHRRIIQYCSTSDLKKKVIFIKCSNGKDGNNNVSSDTKHHIAHTLVYKECEIRKILALCGEMTLRKVEGEYQICGDAQTKHVLQCCASISINGKNIQRTYL